MTRCTEAAMQTTYAMMFSRHNACRPPHARWLVAASLVARDRADDLPADEWVVEAAGYLARLASCNGDPDRQRLADDHPAIDAAYSLFTSGDKLTRGLVEGRLLAGQTDAEVAAACDLTESGVAAYEALFFCVRDRLAARCSIVGNVLGVGFWAGTLTEGDIDAILRYAGYFGGPTVVDDLERFFRRGSWSIPANLAGLTKADLEDLEDVLSCRALILALTTPAAEFKRVARFLGLLKEFSALVATWPQVGEAANEASGNLHPDPAWWAAFGEALASASPLTSSQAA